MGAGFLLCRRRGAKLPSDAFDEFDGAKNDPSVGVGKHGEGSHGELPSKGNAAVGVYVADGAKLLVGWDDSLFFVHGNK